MGSRREFIGETFAFGAAACVPLELKAREAVKAQEEAIKEAQSMSFFVPIIKCDKPSSINRIYPAEVMKKSIEDWKESKDELLGTLGIAPSNSNRVALTEVAFRVNDLVIKNEQGFTVCAAITMLDTPRGKTAQSLIKDICLDKDKKIFEEFAFRPTGMGSCSRNEEGNQVISEYKLISVNMLPAQEASQFNVQHMPV
jgi:hypothetical protein